VSGTDVRNCGPEPTWLPLWWVYSDSFCLSGRQRRFATREDHPDYPPGGCTIKRECPSDRLETIKSFMRETEHAERYHGLELVRHDGFMSIGPENGVRAAPEGKKIRS
jgi:hypothetical protein